MDITLALQAIGTVCYGRELALAMKRQSELYQPTSHYLDAIVSHACVITGG